MIVPFDTTGAEPPPRGASVIASLLTSTALTVNRAVGRVNGTSGGTLVATTSLSLKAAASPAPTSTSKPSDTLREVPFMTAALSVFGHFHLMAAVLMGPP